MNNEKYYKYCFPISDTNEEDTLFDYQKEAIKNLNNHFNLDISIPGRNGLLVMPTGSGKTHTVANWILKHCITKGYQVIWLAHRVELVEQAFCELRDSVKYLKKKTSHFGKIPYVSYLFPRTIFLRKIPIMQTYMFPLFNP